MEERTCIKCGKSFPLTSEYFHYKHKDIGEFHVVCKACRSKNEMRLYYKMKEERPEAYEHRQDVLRKYQEDHREEIRAMSKGKRDRSIDRYRKREAAYVKGKRANDPIFLWVDHARKRIRSAVSTSYDPKYSSDGINEITGLGKDDLRIYLLQTFKETYGYDWDGVEPTHIDHIVPLCTEKTLEGRQKLFDYHNLRLVKARDNMLKCRSLDYQIGVN